MIELADNFKSLPSEFQNVIRQAQDEHNIEITPLQELKGGRTGAYLFLVSVSLLLQSNQVQHLILKLDQKSEKNKMDELERHNIAIQEAPPEFANNHIADLVFERIELNGIVAIFYNIAGQSLHHYKSLANYQQQSKLEKLFSTVNNILLTKWNSNLIVKKAFHPQKILANWLGYRLQAGCSTEHFLEDICHIHQDTAGLMIQGKVFPNPLVYSRKSDLWNAVRPIDSIVGFQHGDLNISNILAQFSEDGAELTGIFLIDFALFKAEMPLLYDQRYLEMSYLIRELSRVSFPKWIDMITRFAEQDIVDPHSVPIELAGACSVINAGRNDFKDWVQIFYPSLSDDLWGQFWLAAVAAGLNYCNKTVINEKDRLAGLVFAAVHLKRYHLTFGVSLPIEVKHLDIENQSVESPSSDSGIQIQKVPQHNLPPQITPFIGRQKEIKIATELLQQEEIRLMTMTGPGGTGKTRLALQTAESMTDIFKDGVYFIDLAPIREPKSVIASIARTVGLRETGDQSLLDEVKTKLRTKKLLLYLDNFEQVTSATPLVGELLRDCPQLKMLITSREALRLQGEHIFPVPPLSMPGADLKQKSLEQLIQYEAVQLFINRATAVRPEFRLTQENATEVAEICSRLDGLPLAIELAAARINLFSPRILLERVGSRLKLLRGGARDLPARQQTLRDAIDWSYELLTTEEQKLFALLSVFLGCTFEQVEVVVDYIKQLDAMHMDTFEGLVSLADKSLLHRKDQERGESRLLMLETIREYAKEQLEKEPEFNKSAQWAHATYFADFTQLQWKRLTSTEREIALSEIESNIENVRTAWHYWVNEQNLEQLHKLTDSVWLLNDARGWYYATVDLTSDLLNVLSSTPSTPERAQQEIMLQTSLARVMLTIKGYTVEVEEAYKRALELCQKHGEIPQSFPVLRGLASFYVYVADFKKSANFGEQILDLAERINDENMKVEGNVVLGYSLVFLGNLKVGLAYLEKGSAIYDPNLYSSRSFHFGNNPGVTACTTSALCLWMLGQPDQALKRADDAIVLANKLNHPFSIAYALFHASLLHMWRGELEIVQERTQTVLEIAKKHEFQIWKAVASCIHGAALVGMTQVEDGLLEIKEGIEIYTELKTPPVFWPMLLLIRAGAFVQSGNPREGLTLIDEALDILGQSSENPILSEVFRFKGEVLLMISSENHIQAETFFQRALDLSRKLDCMMYELKASMSLSKLWQRQGKTNEGQQLMRNVYNKFTEGFATVDLIEAKNLLSDISQFQV
jgi:predicted ATPase